MSRRSEPARIRLGPRHRSVPYKRHFVVAVLFTVAFYLSLVATFAALYASFILRKDGTAHLLGFLVVASTVLWFLSYLKRRSPRCPLCQGTPLADVSARKHVDAKRFFPLNYGNSNVLRCIVTQKYICPYCATPFDLLKRPEKQRPDPKE